MSGKHGPASERIWRFIDKSGPVPRGRIRSRCWLWTGAHNRKGYGHFSKFGDLSPLAHRAVYMLLVGPIPRGLELDHLCGVKTCVRPDHMEPVTPDENKRRARVARTTCRRGHPRTKMNWVKVGGLDATGRQQWTCVPCRELREARRIPSRW